MGASFFIRTSAKSGPATLFVRLQSVRQGINIRLATPIQVDIREWNNSRKSRIAWQNFLSNHLDISMKLSRMKKELEATELREYPATRDEVLKIINDIYYEEQIQSEKERSEEAEAEADANGRITLRKFINQFRRDIASGARLTDRNTVYAKGTVNAINQACERLKKFEKSRHRILDFNDIDLKFYMDYTAYLNRHGYSINTTGKCIKVLKQIMALSEAEGYHHNSKYKDKRFKGTRIEVDSIYLTREELDRIEAVDLSGKPEDFGIARDIFMIGVWTAQRISDYNNIRKEEIESYVTRNQEIKIITITQHKTGAKVVVPCSPHLLKILEKYDYDIPHLPDQLINNNIKEIARMAGLTEEVPVVTTKGGRPEQQMIPKYKLVHSHTARRTGATLMYLSGMDIYDIMKITGHSTPAMLKKYIKADELEVVDKIMSKYDYFK